MGPVLDSVPLRTLTPPEAADADDPALLDTSEEIQLNKERGTGILDGIPLVALGTTEVARQPQVTLCPPVHTGGPR